MIVQPEEQCFHAETNTAAAAYAIDSTPSTLRIQQKVNSWPKSSKVKNLQYSDDFFSFLYIVK